MKSKSFVAGNRSVLPVAVPASASQVPPVKVPDACTKFVIVVGFTITVPPLMASTVPLLVKLGLVRMEKVPPEALASLAHRS